MRRLGAHSCYTVWQTETEERNLAKESEFTLVCDPPPQKKQRQHNKMLTVAVISIGRLVSLLLYTFLYFKEHFMLFKVCVLFLSLKGMISFFFQNQGNKTPMN